MSAQAQLAPDQVLPADDRLALRWATRCLRIFSLVLMGLGMLGDVIAGLAILEHQPWPGLALHVSAVLIWIAGLALWGVRARDRIEIDEQKQRRPGETATSCLRLPASTLGDQTAVAMALGFCLFPGLGPLGCTFAFAIAPCLGGPRKQTPKALETSTEPDLSPETRYVTTGLTSPRVELEIQPLVEVLNKTDFNLKRAAIEVICREPGPRAISLARGLLADADPDVRALAAVAVSKLEAHSSELLRLAVDRRDSQPELAECQAAVGHLYHECAGAGASNPVDRHFYLLRARESLDQAAALDPARKDYLVSLAEILIDLEQTQPAWEAIEKVIALGPGESTGYLLGMEMALKERRFDKIAILAEQACRFLAENDEAMPLMKWWRLPQSRTGAERS